MFHVCSLLLYLNHDNYYPGTVKCVNATCISAAFSCDFDCGSCWLENRYLIFRSSWIVIVAIRKISCMHLFCYVSRYSILALTTLLTTTSTVFVEAL